MDMRTTVPIGFVVALIPAIGAWWVNDYKIARADELLEKSSEYIEANHNRSKENEKDIEVVKEDIYEFKDVLETMSTRQMEQTAILYHLKEQLGTQ